MEISTIKKCFNYNPKTGELFYSENSPINKGKRITRKYVTINKEKISCTKIIYAIMTSELPYFMLGFIDGNNKNWKWENITSNSKVLSIKRRGIKIKNKVEKVSTAAFDKTMDMFLLRGFKQNNTCGLR